MGILKETVYLIYIYYVILEGLVGNGLQFGYGVEATGQGTLGITYDIPIVVETWVALYM